jgi:hypothetical protein
MFFPNHPRVFISYRRAPSSLLALRIDEKLRAKHINSFLDINRQDGGGSIPRWLQEEIEKSDILICLLADTTLDSSWVQEEIEHAYNHDKILLPIFQESFSRTSIPPNKYVEALLNSKGVEVFDRRNFHVNHSINELIAMIKATPLVRAKSKNPYLRIIFWGILILILFILTFAVIIDTILRSIEVTSTESPIINISNTPELVLFSETLTVEAFLYSPTAFSESSTSTTVIYTSSPTITPTQTITHTVSSTLPPTSTKMPSLTPIETPSFTVTSTNRPTPTNVFFRTPIPTEELLSHEEDDFCDGGSISCDVFVECDDGTVVRNGVQLVVNMRSNFDYTVTAVGVDGYNPVIAVGTMDELGLSCSDDSRDAENFEADLPTTGHVNSSNTSAQVVFSHAVDDFANISIVTGSPDGSGGDFILIIDGLAITSNDGSGDPYIVQLTPNMTTADTSMTIYMLAAERSLNPFISWVVDFEDLEYFTDNDGNPIYCDDGGNDTTCWGNSDSLTGSNVSTSQGKVEGSSLDSMLSVDLSDFSSLDFEGDGPFYLDFLFSSYNQSTTGNYVAVFHFGVDG